jgi:hypothetical protein
VPKRKRLKGLTVKRHGIYRASLPYVTPDGFGKDAGNAEAELLTRIILGGYDELRRVLRENGVDIPEAPIRFSFSFDKEKRTTEITATLPDGRSTTKVLRCSTEGEES